MKSPLSAALGTSLLILAACTSTSTPIDNTSSAPSVSSTPAVQETKNVTYQGTLQAAGISIFMEGTHKLQLEDGRFIMLESSDVTLDSYLDQKVEVFGAVRPTVEAGGMIMRVERVTSLESSSSSEAESSLSSTSSSSEESSSEESSSSEKRSVATVSSKATVSSAAPSPVIPSSTPSKSSSSAAPVVSSTPAQPSSPASTYEGSTELTDKANIMAKDNIAANFWTQQYCSKTAGYCVSIHKNWYFKSFGATSATLWHVEAGPQEINNIGEGPLSINLVAGSIESSGAADGQVKTENGAVVGYKAWTDNRHFEIRGPANLQAAITFMLGTFKIN